jgi:hypothetical protein
VSTRHVLPFGAGKSLGVAFAKLAKARRANDFIECVELQAGAKQRMASQSLVVRIPESVLDYSVEPDDGGFLVETRP